MPRYQMEISHDGLGKNRIITANDQYVLLRKVEQQHLAWENERLAQVRTEAAKEAIQRLRSLLATAIESDAKLDWDSLKRSDDFPEAPPPPPEDILSPEPQPKDSEFRSVLVGRVNREKFERAHEVWLKQKQRIDPERDAYSQQMAGWMERRRQFCELQNSANDVIDKAKENFALAVGKYEKGDASLVAPVIESALLYFAKNSPVTCEQPLDPASRVNFVPEGGTLIVDYSLPGLLDIPDLKEVRYLSSRGTFDEVRMRPTEITSLFENVIYQICLRTIYLTFLFDTVNAVASVVFNGWVTFADPATGNDTRACILSVQAERNAFKTINLPRVDPKACFRALKGIGSSQLHTMVPVAPLLRADRNDRRFVESVEVANRIKEGTNIAAIGWEDFEHLIREIFEMEFKAGGGEVRVTRASRDWGVDAIAFDPDPIRGGKIVIQAKRYTNTVEVSAVRDLYGTVMNEGATKGILVTTSTFGPEAYAFAKGKPLTLLDGSNLLHLLERHGQRAYIDLAEAKRLNPTPLARTIVG